MTGVVRLAAWHVNMSIEPQQLMSRGEGLVCVCVCVCGLQQKEVVATNVSKGVCIIRLCFL